VKSFREFIIEVIEWQGNTLFAMGPSGKVEYHDDRKERMTEHPDAFKHLNFMNRPHSGEIMIGIEDLRDPNARGRPGADRPKAIAWGRIDHNNNVIHIITQHGTAPYGVGEKEKDKRKREDDVFNRIEVLKQVASQYPGVQIHHGYEGADPWSSPRTPRIISIDQYEKELMKHLEDQ
jgi:hypothetical protein